MAEGVPAADSDDGEIDWLPVAVSPDPSDPKLAHLDGLNLSRAWMLEGIAQACPRTIRAALRSRRTAEAHRRAGLAAVTGEHYEGGHWLGSFAVLSGDASRPFASLTNRSESEAGSHRRRA